MTVLDHMSEEFMEQVDIRGEKDADSRHLIRLAFRIGFRQAQMEASKIVMSEILDDTPKMALQLINKMADAEWDDETRNKI